MNVGWQGTACKPGLFYLCIINVYSDYCKKGVVFVFYTSTKTGSSL